MAKTDKYGIVNAQDPQVDTKGIKSVVTKVTEGVKWRKDAKFDETWSKLIKLYANRYEYPELDGYQDVIAPNMVFSTVNVIVPSIVVNYPKITVTATKQEFEATAGTVEAVANYHWRHFDVHKEFRAVVKDFAVIGHGWCKTTWEYEEKLESWTLEEWQAEAQQALTEIEMKRQQAVSAGVDPATLPSDEQVLAGIPKRKTTVIKDNPVVERVSPFDVFVDPNGTRIKDVGWIAQRMYVPYSKASKRKDWDETARKRMNKTTMKAAKEDIDVNYENEERLGDSCFVVVWEFYDLLEGTVATFADGADRFLSEPKPIPFAFEHPFVYVTNYEVPEKFYPIGDVEAVAPLQMELALTRTQMVADRKRFRRMYLVREDDIGPDGMDAMRSGDDNAIISVEGDKPFGDILAPVQTTALPPEFYNQTAMILDDINLVSGVSEYQRGSVAEIRRTATEASMIQDASNARAADKLTIIERAIGEVAQRLVQLSQQFLGTEQVAKIVGENGVTSWVPYSREDIQGEFDFSVEAGSTQPQNETARRQSAMQMMDAMAPFIGTGVIDPRKVAEHVLRNGFGIKNPSEFMMPPPQMAPGVPGADGSGAGEPPMPPMPPQGVPAQGVPMGQ